MRQLITEGLRLRCCVTSPPYWGLRDYGVAGQIGLSGTTGQVAQDLGRRWLGCELNADYVRLERRRTAQQTIILDVPIFETQTERKK